MRDTRPSASDSTVSHLLGPKKCSMTRSMPLHTEAAQPMNQPSVRATCANKPDSFAHVARTPNDTEEVIDDSQGREQDLSSGRCGVIYQEYLNLEVP